MRADPDHAAEKQDDEKRDRPDDELDAAGKDKAGLVAPPAYWRRETTRQTTRTPMIVGTTITSMMARALSRIWILAAPIGPCGSSTPPEQPASSKSKVAAFAIRENNFGRFDAGQSDGREGRQF